jgi:hypothetical protein
MEEIAEKIGAQEAIKEVAEPVLNAVQTTTSFFSKVNLAI